MQAWTRLAFAAALLALLLPLAAGAASAAVPRLHVGVGYPTPGVAVTVYEHEDCLAQRLAWQGAWFSLAEPLNWAYDGDLLERGPQAGDRAYGAAELAYTWAVARALDAEGSLGDWAFSPVGPALWALATLGDEDVCLLMVVEVTTGLTGPGA